MAGLGSASSMAIVLGESRCMASDVDSGTMRSEGSKGTAASPLARPPAARHWPERHARK